MITSSLPSTIKAWQYSSTKGGLDKNLKINPSAPLPSPKPNQHLVQVIATALNPVDYKPAEIPLIATLILPKPATPGIDFAGRIVTPATGSSFQRGQLIFGLSGTSHLAGGALSEFALAKIENIVALPDGVDPIDAATIGVAGLTAYQSIVPRVNKGDKVFINGGSGGTGVFGIQIAKAVGCHVTTTCSSANVELCKSLGADEVVDYKKESVIEALKAGGHKFDHVVDNVGADPQLYWRCHEYMKPGAVYVMVGGTPSLAYAFDTFKMMLWPGSLGGGKRKFVGFFPKPKHEDLEQIGTWMKEGQVKAIIDQKFSFEEAPKAFEKLKTGRATGKIVVDVASETYRETPLV
jgi:NADPH:quinone reductase-like Zn-dependent oxidoreductase